MLALFYDTETNGFPLFSEPSDDPRQPHIVQLAATLVDLESREVLQSVDLIAGPDEWEIPVEVAAIHGITTEHAAAVGVSEALIVDAVMSLWVRADVRIAHNESFDSRVMRIALKRFFGDDAADTWMAGTAECTCFQAAPIVKLPPSPKMIAAGRRHHKKPSLTEAYTHFFGKPFENAHSAMADVRACMDVYFAIQDAQP